MRAETGLVTPQHDTPHPAGHPFNARKQFRQGTTAAAVVAHPPQDVSQTPVAPSGVALDSLYAEW
jgi:hypothetical protein